MILFKLGASLLSKVSHTSVDGKTVIGTFRSLLENIQGGVCRNDQNYVEIIYKQEIKILDLFDLLMRKIEVYFLTVLYQRLLPVS